MEEVLVFPSTYHMLRSEELLRRGGFALRLVPAPPQAGELCTTAIAVSSRDREKIVSYLDGEKILIKAVLPYERRLERSLALAIGKASRERDLPPSLGAILGALCEGRQLAVAEITELLALAEGEEAGAVVEAAEAATRARFGGKAAALVGARLGAGGAGACDTRGIEAVVEEMGRQGFVHLLLDLGDVEDVPWTEAELRGALGEGVIALMSAASLTARAGELVKGGVIRQFLVPGGNIFSLGAEELAQEMVFLRDNRPGPIGSGNLVPLLDRDMGAEAPERLRRVRAVLAVCRLVLGDAFLPAAPMLWRAGGLAGADMLVLEVTERPLAEAAAEAESRLEGMGLSFKRVTRKDGRGAGPPGESGT